MTNCVYILCVRSCVFVCAFAYLFVSLSVCGVSLLLVFVWRVVNECMSTDVHEWKWKVSVNYEA